MPRKQLVNGSDGSDLRAVAMLIVAALLGTGVIVWGTSMFILVRWMVGV